MSTKTITGGKLAIEESDVVMVAYNLEYTDEGEVIQYARQHNKGAFIKKAFASGRLPAGESLRYVLCWVSLGCRVS